MNFCLRLQYCALAAALIFLAGCQSAPPHYPTAKISRVISGNSIEWIDRSQQLPIIQQGRLIGIDAPDLAQEPWGKQAKQRLEELIGATDKETVSVEVEETDADKFGRKFVYLWKDGRLLNEQLLKDGCVLPNMRSASAATTNPSGAKYRERFSRASQYARLIGRGIWNPDRPLRMSPSEFRKEEK